MSRIVKLAVLYTVVVLPAVAYGVLAPAQDGLCLASGGATYRIAHAAAADFSIKIVSETEQPDLRMQWVDRPELADFVLVDDLNGGGHTDCRSASTRTVAFHSGVAAPDVTVKLSAESSGDYKIYVQSARFSQQDAAALLAAIWKANQGGDVTGSIRIR